VKLNTIGGFNTGHVFTPASQGVHGMIVDAYDEMEEASRKPTFGKGSSPKQDILENAMAMLQLPEFKMFSKKRFLRVVWNEGHKNENLLSIFPKKRMTELYGKRILKRYATVLRNPILPRNYLKAMDEGWTGFPTWSIQPTISAHQLTGNPPKKPPFGLFFVFNKDEEKAADGLDAVEGTLLGQFGQRSEIDEGAMIELMFPYPNWKDNLIPWLAEKKLDLRDIALYKAHIELRKVKIIDDLTFHHEGSIRGEQMEKVKNWVDSIDFETGMITDTPEYRAWMIASGLFLEPDFRENPPGIPRDASQLSTEEKKDIRKRWRELVNMTATELQTFYDSDLGNKKAGLSREEAKEAGISSGRDSALAIIKMKQTPVKEWHKRHSKDRGRDIMLDFWQWAQKQINFNTRHRGMRGPYLDEKGRPTRKLLGLWIWGHDPWRYAIKVKSERLPKCPDVPWIGSAEKKKFGVLPKMNPKFKVLMGNIVTISGPSSSGKSTIAKALSEKMRASMVPSYMTREPRPNEQQGVDGYFVSVERFEDMINNGDFTTKEGVNLWVKQKNGEYYGRRVSDFMGSKPVVVDVNFEGLRKMRKAFPGRTYSVFIRTRQGPKRRRENLEKRGVHTEEEIEARVRAGTAMLQTFGDMNFDFIASNKFGEVEKNVAMIASEFKKWEKAPKANPKFPKPSKRCGHNKPCGGKVIYKSMAAANKAINSGLAGGHTAYHSPQCQDKNNPRVYHTRTTSYMFNPPTLRMGAELLHKPSGQKLKYIEAEIDEDGKTWYIVEDMAGRRSRLEDDDLEFYSLWPKSSLWQTNPPFNLRDIISVMSPRAIGALGNAVRQFLMKKPKRPKKPTLKSAQKRFDAAPKDAKERLQTPERLLQQMIERYNRSVKDYQKRKEEFEYRLNKLKRFYGYGGESKTKMVDAIINTIAKEFKGKPVVNGYRAQFALNIDKEQMLDFLRDNGPGKFFSTWKQGADIYFDKFSKTESWTKVPGGVVWLITAEISVLDIDWVITLRNRFQFPEEKELALLRSPMEAKQFKRQSPPYSVRNYVTVKRIDVWDAKAVSKYAQKFDMSGGGMRRQPWLSSKLKPLVSHDLMMKANPPVGDFEGAMDMGIQKDGPSRYHGHYPSGVESFVPDMATQWKKKSFRVEMPLNSKAEADGTYTMGFLEKHEDDDRPYIVSIKYDGDNNILYFDGEETVLFTRRGRWRKDFHLTDQITASLKKNGVSSAIILGELYVVDQDGKTVPLSQQSSFTQAPKNLGMQESMRFAAFDILEINGKNIEDTPYAARMDILKPLIHGDAVKVVEHWRSKGGMNEVMEAWNEGISNDPNFEGLIVRFEGDKKSIKVKMHGTADLVVLGFYYGEEGGRDEAVVGGGALAWMDENGDFVLAGNSVLGSSVVEKAELLQRLLPTAVDAPKVKWGDHIVDRSITHDHRGRGAITPVEPHLIGEFKYRSLNYSERPVYRFEDGHYFQVGTKRAPVLFQCTFGRWRPDKSLTHQDLRMSQVAGEGEGKWKKNPPEDDDTNYPGGTAQFLLDGILLGSLKSKMNDWRTEGVSKTVTLKDWPIHYPELAARLEEAEKLGWSVPSIPKVKVNPPPKPRKKGKRKEPAKSYLQRFMGHPKMVSEFPDSSQRYAVGLSYVEKFYGKAAKERIAPPLENPPVFSGIQEAHEHYDYPGSHRTGSVISDGVVVRSYSTGEIDTISADENKVKYKIKTKALNDAFKMNKSERKPIRFFLKKSDGVHDMGLYDVAGVRNKVATMIKQNPPWEEDEDEEPPTPEEYSVPDEKGVVAQHIETQDEAESIALRWTKKTDEDFVAFEMIYTMPDGSRRWAVVRKPEGGKSGSPLVSPMRSSPHYLESANKYGLGPDCPRCGSNYTEKVGKIRVAVQDGPAHVMEGGYHCNYCGFDWDTESIDLVRLNPPKKTPGGKTIPERYLKGLTKEEMQIAIKEIDKGYKYDVDDPEAYEYWKSDIKATARGYKTVPSKYKKEFIKLYGPLPEKGKFIDKIAKATKIKKRILKKVYDKGLAAWRTGHRPGVQQHQWAAGRVYSFVTLGNTVVKDKKKMSDYTLAVEAGLIKDGDLIKKNPPLPRQNKPFPWNQDWIAKSPLKTLDRARKAERKYNRGEDIGFTFTSSLKSMGRIKRSHGQYEVGEKYAKMNGVLPIKKGGTFPKAGYIYDPPGNEEYASHVEVQKNKRKYNKLVKDWMNKNHDASWSWTGDFKTEAEKKKFKQAKAYAKQNIDGPIVCSDECIACFYKQGGMTEAEIRERAKGVKENPPPRQAVEIPTVIVFKGMIRRELADGFGSEDGIFIFGDNEARRGKGGQAKELRGLDNAYGIRTKKRPSLDESAFWSDKTYKTNIKMMSEDFLEAFMAAGEDGTLYVPQNGIGTGMAQLKSRAPKTYKWLKTFLDNLIRTGDEQDVKDNIKKWRMK